MELLKCKACGCQSMAPVELAVEEESDSMFNEKESRFFTCHVCGDNWLSVKETDAEGSCQVTFVHQMGMQPVLKRIALMQTPIVIKNSAVGKWKYYFGDDVVEESQWRNRLKKRREILKSVCSN